uniref:ATP synthase F0 subunit 8 n=1 Tax=Tsukubamonas globosa TaxID=875863 RepID=W8VTH2_9EUKA|nr:ATP synthase F0 subunit 8 [Tsukubamonas globosa]BAO51983.1 ATP synthase F0 subunit 8 [Tsukubamonas globosa]
MRTHTGSCILELCIFSSFFNMPQLDSVTYFLQFNWLFVIFIGLYLASLLFVFPSIATVVKARSRKILKDKLDLSAIEHVESNTLHVYEKIWESVLALKDKQLTILRIKRNNCLLNSKSFE